MADSDIVDLQTQLAFQEDLVAQLNEALAQQQQDIAELKEHFALLKQQYQELRQQLGGDAGAIGDHVDEKPPHY